MKACLVEGGRCDWRILLFVLTAICLAMGVLNGLTGMFGDDYALAYTFDAGCLNYNRPIRCIDDIFYSQYYHYLFRHGRVVTEGLVQMLVSLRDKHVFDVANSVLFVVYLYLLQLHGGRFTWVGTVFAVAMTIVFTRAFGEVFLWMSGSVNYLWVACMNLLLLYVFKKKQEDNSLFATVCYAILAFIIGSMQEGFSVGICAALVLCVLWRWKKEHKPFTAVSMGITIGYMAGVLFDFLSPGIWIRARENGIDQGYNVRFLLDGIVYVLAGLRVFWIVVVMALIQSLHHRIVLRDLLRRNSLFLCAMLVQALFLMMLGRAAEPRSLFAIEMFALIILLQLVPVQSVRLGVASLIVFVAVYVPVLQLNLKNYQATQAFLKELAASDGTVFFDVPYYSRSERHYLGSFIQMDHRRPLFKAEATYYGKKNGILVLPRRFREELYLTSSFIQPKNYYHDGEYSSDDIFFTVKPLPDSIHKSHPSQAPYKGEEFVSFPSGNYLLKDKRLNDQTTKRPNADKDYNI